MKKLLAIGLVCAFLAVNADTDLYWRGATANPVWDTTTANWATSAGGAASTAFYNDSTYARFDGGGAKDITVNSGGVTTFAIRSEDDSSQALHGGPVSATYIFPYGGNLTIFNNVSGYIFTRGGSLTVGDGGYLNALGYLPDSSNESGLNSRLTVLTGGVFRANIDADRVATRYATLYFDGGTLVHPGTADRQFVNSRLLLGAGGMRVKEASAGQYSYIPGPIGTDVDNDSGIWIEEHTGYMLLPNYASTYRGGIHILGSGGYIAVRDDSHLGAEPTTPTNSIVFANNSSGYSSLLVAHNNVTLHPNRDILISDGVRARISGRNSSNSWTIRSTISCNPAGSGKLRIVAFGDGPRAKAVSIETVGGRTNHIGALIVNAPAIIGSGTTLLDGALTGVGDSSMLDISGDGHLMVTGGVLRVVNGNYVCNSRLLTISGGIADFSAGDELLNANSAAATTTVSRAGRLVVKTMRVGESSSVSHPSGAVVRIADGGVLRVNRYLWVGVGGRKGMLDFDGGTLEWASDYYKFTHPNYAALGPQYEGSKEGLSVVVREGGMIVTNDKPLYVEQSIQSGSEHDGGITKWGTDELALQNGTNTFNGPIRVMQGSFAVATGLRNAINTNATVCVNVGARFRMNGAYHVFSRIEGGGEYAGMVNNNLTVREAIAPGMGADKLGTLTISGGPCNIEDGVALEIDVDVNGNSDCFCYPGRLDLSKMTLKVNDITKLNRDRRYVVASLPNGVIGEFKSVPEGWKVRYSASSHVLMLLPQKGLVISIN